MRAYSVSFARNLASQAPTSVGFSRQEHWSGKNTAISSSRGFSWSRDKARASCIGRGIPYQLFYLRSPQFTQYRKCCVQGCVSCLPPTDIVRPIPEKAMALFNEFGGGALLRAFKMIFFLMKQMLRRLISPQTFFQFLLFHGVRLPSVVF